MFSDFGFDLNKQTILLTGGGVGVKSLNKSIEKLSSNDKFQLIIIAGKLDEYKKQLEDQYSLNKNIKVLGYINNIQDYLNASDIIIGKPGPATILEIELFNKKAILTRKIGEQEIGNIDYALRNPKFRYISDKWSRLDETIEELASMNTESNLRRRNFNECDMMAKEIYTLLQTGESTYDHKIKRRKLEQFFATTVAVSAVALGVYKLVRKVTKK